MDLRSRVMALNNRAFIIALSFPSPMPVLPSHGSARAGSPTAVVATPAADFVFFRFQ
jgi:hypothetical protein